MQDFLAIVLAGLSAYAGGALAKSKGGSAWFWGSASALAAILLVSALLFSMIFGFSSYGLGLYLTSALPITVIQLVLGAVCAYICGAWAKSQGKSAWLWGSVGATISVFGIAVLAAVLAFQKLAPKSASPTGSLKQGNMLALALIGGGILVGLVLGIVNRPALPGVGQPPIDVAFSTFGIGGDVARGGDFIANQTARLNASLASRYSGEFAQTLIIYGLVGGAAGALLAFLLGKKSTGQSTSNALPERWQTLIAVDPDIAAAAAEARGWGLRFERELAEKYLTLNDKSYLPALLKSVRSGAVGDDDSPVPATFPAGQSG